MAGSDVAMTLESMFSMNRADATTRGISQMGCSADSGDDCMTGERLPWTKIWAYLNCPHCVGSDCVCPAN